MIVGAHLNRAVTRIDYFDFRCFPATIGYNIIGRKQIFAWYHKLSRTRRLANRPMDRHQFRSVGERSFDLNFGEHFRHALHHIVAGQDRRAKRYEVSQ